MALLSYPDVNVWFALLVENHLHHEKAVGWWRSSQATAIGICRATQISVLRLLTTAAAMNGNPLTMAEPWASYDRLFGDDRVCLLPEPSFFETDFRKSCSSMRGSSPQMWADAYLTAFADGAGATLVTFDQGLSGRVGS